MRRNQPSIPRARLAGRGLALPTLLLVLGAVVMATRGPAAVEGNVAQAAVAASTERVIAYAVTSEHGPRFRLPGGPELIRVTSHLVLPSGAYIAGRRYAFGLDAIVRSPDGEVVWRRHLSERTGQTKAGPRPDGWAFEAAFAADRRYELSDSAGVDLALPDCPPSSTLELRLSGPTGLIGQDGNNLVLAFRSPTALVRVHRRVDIADSGESLRRSATAAALGPARLAAATFLPWHALRETHRAHAEAEAWERMPAEGRAGIDYRGESVYVAATPPPAPPPPEPPAIAIGKGQSAIVHVIGPGTAVVRVRSGENATSDAEQAVSLTARWLGPFPAAYTEQDPEDIGKQSMMSLPVRDVWDEQAVPLPAGWTSLELATELGAAEVQVRVEDGARHATAGAGEPEDARDAVLADAAATVAPASDPQPTCADSALTYRAACSLAPPPPTPSQMVPVDLRTLPLYSVSGTTAPMPIALVGPSDIYTRTLRLDVRTVGELTPVTLHVEFLDERGRVVASDELTAEPVSFSTLDRLRAPSVFHTPTDDADDSDDNHPPLLMPALGLPLAERPISEPVALRLLAPPDAVRLQIAAASPALLDIRGVLPPSDELVGSKWIWPYDQVSAVDERWRYAPRLRDRWFPLRAEDHPARLAAGQVVPLQAQVRREPDPRRPTTEGPWITLHPRGGAVLDVLELVPASERGEAIASWGPGDVSALRPGVIERIDLRRGGKKPAWMRYIALGTHTRALGQDIDLVLNETESQWKVAARAEARRLKRPVGGLLSMTWSSGPEPVRVLVNRPTTTGAPIYTARKVHRLGDAPLRLDVAKQTDAVEVVHVVAYWLSGPAKTPTTVRVQIDDGAPRRHGARSAASVSQGERTVVLYPDAGAEVIRGDRDDPVRAQRTTFSVRLGDDLAPGDHKVTIHRVDGPPVHVRMFREAPRAESSALEGIDED